MDDEFDRSDVSDGAQRRDDECCDERNGCEGEMEHWHLGMRPVRLVARWLLGSWSAGRECPRCRRVGGATTEPFEPDSDQCERERVSGKESGFGAHGQRGPPTGSSCALATDTSVNSNRSSSSRTS